MKIWSMFREAIENKQFERQRQLRIEDNLAMAEQIKPLLRAGQGFAHFASTISEPATIKFSRCKPDAKIPKRSTDGAAGFDLYSTGNFELRPGAHALIPSGIKVAIPAGYCGQIWPRSGLAVKHGIDRLAGLIDSDYRGELQISLINHSKYETMEVRRGDRIAQLVITPYLALAIEVDDLNETKRGEGGFGSTGY